MEFYTFLQNRIAKNCSLFITNGNMFLTLRNLDATTCQIESSKYGDIPLKTEKSQNLYKGIISIVIQKSDETMAMQD